MTAIAFERQLAMHCAPALVGIKPANIVTFSVKDGEEGMRPGELAAAYNRRFQGRDLRFRILRECPRRRLLMVYRPSKLERHLRRPEVRQILAAEGYREAELEELLGQLEERVRRSGSCDFPHEIGLFPGISCGRCGGIHGELWKKTVSTPVTGRCTPMWTGPRPGAAAGSAPGTGC